MSFVAQQYAAGPDRLSRSIEKAARRAYRRRGFVESHILLEWPVIVGETLARCTLPLKLAFRNKERNGGILHLRVIPGFATEVQHLEPIILDKLAVYCGYRAVARLQITQGPLISNAALRPAPSAAAPATRVLSDSDRHALQEALRLLEPSPLRVALESLGHTLYAHRTVASRSDTP